MNIKLSCMDTRIMACRFFLSFSSVFLIPAGNGAAVVCAMTNGGKKRESKGDVSNGDNDKGEEVGPLRAVVGL